jgi:hypothetical protein
VLPPEFSNQSFEPVPFEYLEHETPEQQPERLRVSAEFLERLYGSRSFAQKLTETMHLVGKFDGREFGFVIWKDRDSDGSWMTQPAGGEFDAEVDMGAQHKELALRLEKQHPNKVVVRLSKLHFHGILGRDANILVPSGTELDLGAASADRDWNAFRAGVDLPSIEMIGLLDPQGEAQVLVFQEPLGYRPMHEPAICDEIDLTLEELAQSSSTTQQDVIEALRHYKYKASVLKTSGGSLRDEDLKNLSKLFATDDRI